MGKHKHSKVKGFLNFSREAEIHAVPKSWDERIPMLREKYEKTQTFQIPITWKHSVESHIIPKLWAFEEIRTY